MSFFRIHKKPILVVLNSLMFSVMIGVNYLANTGIINGQTIKTVSDRYHNLFIPAGYAFSIWGLIYLALLAFLIYTIVIINRRKESQIIVDVGYWFMVSCWANILWIFAWLYDFLGLSVGLMAVLLFTLLKIVVRTHMELTNPPFRIVAFLWWPFSLYAGWVLVALIANTAAYLTKIEWDGFGIPQSIWATVMIIAAGLLYIVMTWKRHMREFAAVGIWAFIGIAIATKDHWPTVYLTALITAIGVGLSCLLNSALNFRGFGKTYEDYEDQGGRE